MSRTQTLTRSYSGGVIAPEMYGRADLPQYHTGLSKCENFVIRPTGALSKRPGLEYLLKIRGTTAPRVIDFEKDTEVSFALVFYTNGIMFFKNGEVVVEVTKTATAVASNVLTFGGGHNYLAGDWIGKKTLTGDTTVANDNVFLVDSVSGNDVTVSRLWLANGDIDYPTTGLYGRVYTVATTIGESQLASMRTSQSDLTLSLQVEGEYPRELTYVSDASWTYGAVSFKAGILPANSENPYNGSGSVGAYCFPWPNSTATLSTNTEHALRYRLTSVSEDGEESICGEDALSQPGTTDIIGAATSANPGVFTTAFVHGLVANDVITVWGLAGGTWSTLNLRRFKINSVPTTTTFTLRDASTDVIVNSSLLGTYTANSGSFYLVGTRCDLSVAGARVGIGFYGNSDLLSRPAMRYNVYKQDRRSLVYGFAGTVDPSTAEKHNGFLYFFDDNIVPDVTRSPPEEFDPFTTGDKCPTAVANHNQRRVFGGSNEDPQRIWMTPIGFPSSMNQHFPILDSDAFDFRISAQRRQKIQHIVSLGDMLVLTTGAAFQISGDAVPPSARVQGFIGANDTSPAECDGSVVFIANGSSHPYEIAYDRTGSGGYSALDIGVLSPANFDGYTIDSMTFCRGPVPTLWCVRQDAAGVRDLIACTYLPGQEIRAWHTHPTTGTPISVCAVRENNVDRLYLTVRRGVHFHLERLAPYLLSSQNEALFVDAGVYRTGSPTLTVSGAWHLEGAQVSVLADGVAVSGLTVSGGALTLPHAASKVSFGLSYTSDAETLPLALEIQGGGMGRMKGVTEVDVRLFQTGSVKFGDSFDNLTEWKPEVAGAYSAPAPLISEEVNIPIDASWNSAGTLCMRSSDPVPVTILSMAITVAIGG